jgi:putative two-component system response regulator
MIQKEQWEELIRIGIDLSSYKELDLLLEKIAADSLDVVGCEGASIYIKRGDHLEFMTTKNRILEKKLGNLKKHFQKYAIPISNESISGYVALTRTPLNLPNVYLLDESVPYRFYDNFDRLYQYHTISMLTLPMLDNRGELVGVLQMINSYDSRNAITVFNEQDLFIAQYLCSIAAMSIKNASFSEILKSSYYETVERLALASEFRDLETSNHIKRMSEYSLALWKKCGGNPEEAEDLRYAAQMHDIGKIGIPDRILQKPGPLTPEERKIMEKHTIIGGKILEGSSSGLLRLSKTVALTHHEKWDGTGYPAGLKGEEIPLAGRIVALADVFDALTSKRVYKPAFSSEKVFSMIQEEKGKHFDPKIVQVFLESSREILAIHDRYKE